MRIQITVPKAKVKAANCIIRTLNDTVHSISKRWFWKTLHSNLFRARRMIVCDWNAIWAENPHTVQTNMWQRQKAIYPHCDSKHCWTDHYQKLVPGLIDLVTSFRDVGCAAVHLWSKLDLGQLICIHKRSQSPNRASASEKNHCKIVAGSMLAWSVFSHTIFLHAAEMLTAKMRTAQIINAVLFSMLYYRRSDGPAKFALCRFGRCLLMFCRCGDVSGLACQALTCGGVPSKSVFGAG
jgi:hypothetical protein